MYQRNSDSGSAIITVIVFITVILLFISLIIMYNRYQNISILNYGNNIQTYYNAKSAVYLSLKKYKDELQKKYYRSTTYNYNLFNNDSTTVTIEPWGLFLKCSAESKIKTMKSQRTFLVGVKGDERLEFAMVMGDIRNPVIVAGNTSITGDVQVGPQGIKAGVLKGIRYKGNNPVYGRIHKDNKSHFPSFKPDILFSQTKLLGQSYNNVRVSDYPDKRKLDLENRSYSMTQKDIYKLIENGIDEITGPGVIVFSGNVNIENINILNQVVLYSDDVITFSTSGTAEHILVFAKEILIEGDLSLRGQFFATEKLTVNNGAQLKYPSVIGLISKSGWDEKNQLWIGNNVTINGAVIIANSYQLNLSREKHKLIIDKSAIVNGLTYSDNYTELWGTVYGTVMTNEFCFYYSPTTFINWIKDAVINRNILDSDYNMPLGFDVEPDLTVIQEL